MITLFKPNETNFDHNGLGSLDKNILETVVEEELNGLYSFVFKYPIFAPHGSEIDGQSVIRVPTPDGNQLFRVYNPIKSMGYVTIKTYHIFYDLADNFVEDTNIVGKNGQGAITQLGGATQYSHTFRFFSDIETTTNARIVRMNPVAALIDDEEDNTFISRWGGELKRNNFDVRMNKSIGTNRGKKIQHRKDLIGYEANVNWSTAITRIMPKGFDGLLLPEKYVDSPLINHYINPKIKVVEYSEVKAAVGEYANDKDAVPLQTAYQLLRERANEEYSVNKVDIPEATYKVDFVSLDQTEEYKDLQELQKVFLGDTVTVEHKEDGLNIEAKVISYKYDPLAKKYLGFELGSFKETFTSKYSDITKLTRKVTELVQITNFIQSTADGKNTINRGTSEPLYPNINDLWYKPNGSETELWQYVDENGVIYWKMISSTAELNAVKNEVNAAIEQADLDRTKAEQDFESAKQEAKQYTEAKAQEFDNQLLIVNQNVLTATNSANAAVLKADKAIEDAGFMRVDVDAAKVNAIDALTKAQSATDNVNSLSTSFDALTQTVGFKAEKAQVNALSGVIDQHTLDITANAQAINARLTSAQVDSLVTGKGYVNQSQLTATSSQWNLALTQVSTDLSNLEITDRNLIKYSNKFYGTGGSGAAGVTPSVTADGNLQVIAAAGNANYLNGFMPTANVMSEELKEGDKFTISFTIKSANSTGIPDIYVKPGMGYFPMKGKMGTEFSTVYYTGIWKTANAVAFHMGFSGLVGTFIIKDMKLQKGEKPTGWSPAIEDMATLEKFTTLEATVNGINTVVGTKASQTQVTQLAGQITSKVESATYNSKMTQLDSAINLRVVQSDVTAAILADKNIKDTRNDNQMPNWYFSNYPNKEAREFKLRSVLGLPGASTYVQLTTKVPWTETSGGVPIQIAESNDGVYQRASNSAATAWLAWDKVAESGKLISQINVSTEGILLQGKRIQLDGDVTMNTAFVTRLDVLALSAVYADIPTIRNKVLITDVVTTNMIKADAGLFDKVFINDAVVQKLTVKSSFISSVKAIDITADKITGGTANFANFNAINFNANSITSGTVSGASSTWNLNTGLMNFTNPSTGDLLQLMQGEIRFQNGAQGRYLKYQSEGLLLQPFASNTGTSKNTALHLIGGGPGSYQYIQFVSQDLSGVNMRLQAEGQNMTAFHGSTGSFIVSKYGDSTATGTVISGGYETRHPTGISLKIAGDSISTPRDGSRNIYLTPQGTGSVVSGAANGTRYTFVASDFVKQSSRDTKTNIIPLESGLDNIRQLRPVSYNKIDKLNRGIFEIEKGFIAEDSLMVATVDGKGIYDSHITAYLVKGVQELDQKVISIDSLATTANSIADNAMNKALQIDGEVQQMKNKIIELEKEIKTLKGAA